MVHNLQFPPTRCKCEKALMKTSSKQWWLAAGLALIGGAALAKLPALSDEAKAKAAEAAAKAAWTGKLEGYQLCKAQDKVAAAYKKAKPAASACVDPGPFAYTAAAAAPASPAATAVPANKP